MFVLRTWSKGSRRWHHQQFVRETISHDLNRFRRYRWITAFVLAHMLFIRPYEGSGVEVSPAAASWISQDAYITSSSGTLRRLCSSNVKYSFVAFEGTVRETISHDLNRFRRYRWITAFVLAHMLFIRPSLMMFMMQNWILQHDKILSSLRYLTACLFFARDQKGLDGDTTNSSFEKPFHMTWTDFEGIVG